MKKTLIFSALAIVFQAGLASAACMDVDLVDRNSGETLQKFEHRGQTYVAGHPGQRYSIRLSNCSQGDELAVVSVDGVNVVTGETASHTQGGYVIQAYGNTEINGWRKNLSEIAAFHFTPESKSYAARTGRPGNVGVIGVAVFDAKPPVQYYERQQPQMMDKSMPSARGMSESANSFDESPKLGTGHGRKEIDQATTTTFERMSRHPQLTISLRYDTYRNLRRMGVIPREDMNQSGPNPFPGNRGFVPDPR